MVLDVDAGDKIIWEHMHALAARIDEIATLLEIPAWFNLTDDVDLPFTQANVYTAPPLRIHYSVTVGQTIATEHYLAEARETPWAFPSTTLTRLADVSELYLTTAADGCWCAAIHQVLRAGVRAYLRKVDRPEGHRCCWAVEIPQLGEDLGLTDSAVVNSAQVSAFAAGVVIGSEEAFLWRTEVGCVAGSQLEYKLQRTSHNFFQLVAVERTISTEFFTWPILKRYMDALKDKIEQLCIKSGGAKPYRWRIPMPDHEHAIIAENSEHTVCEPPPTGGDVWPPGVAPGIDLTVNDPTLGEHVIDANDGGTLGFLMQPRLWPLAGDTDRLNVTSSYYYLNAGCLVQWPHIKHTYYCLNDLNVSEVPGAMVQLPDIFPWDAAVYDAAACETATPLITVYAATFKQLDGMLDLLAYGLLKYDSKLAGDCCYQARCKTVDLVVGPGASVDSAYAWDTPPVITIDSGCAPAYARIGAVEGEDLHLLWLLSYTMPLVGGAITVYAEDEIPTPEGCNPDYDPEDPVGEPCTGTTPVVVADFTTTCDCVSCGGAITVTYAAGSSASAAAPEVVLPAYAEPSVAGTCPAPYEHRRVLYALVGPTGGGNLLASLTHDAGHPVLSASLCTAFTGPVVGPGSDAYLPGDPGLRVTASCLVLTSALAALVQAAWEAESNQTPWP